MAKCWYLLGQCIVQFNDCSSIRRGFGKTLADLLYFLKRSVLSGSLIYRDKVSLHKSSQAILKKYEEEIVEHIA